MISLDEFLQLPVEEVAKLVRESGPKVVVFPINGTRRWFALEYGAQGFENPITAYMDIAQKKHIELYKLFFDHGVDTLITPAIGPEILATRDAYMQKIGGEALARLAGHEEFLDFYKEYCVRVHFYGDYRENLQHTPFEYLSDLFDGIAQNTGTNDRYRLFFGAFADNLNSANVVAKFSVEFSKQYGRTPNRDELIAMYYGEHVEKASIFIGFDRFAVFDYPLINWGAEDLYFMAAPSCYLNPHVLRKILYDHIYTRKHLELDHLSQPLEKTLELQEYYRSHKETVFGIGRILNGTWIPLDDAAQREVE
jgi:tuberculosinol/isotuberculosinol synthase